MKEQKHIAFSITSDYDSIRKKEVFSDLLKVLMVYTHSLIGDSTLRLSKNKTELAYDMAMESITRYLENPSEFDPTRNPNLVWYLKYNILQRLISNFKALKGQKNELLYENNDSNGMVVMNAFSEENDVHDLIDLKNTIRLIKEDISDNSVLLELFELRYINDYSRAETIEKLSITKGEYNNRIRRLETIRKRVIKLQESEIKI